MLRIAIIQGVHCWYMLSTLLDTIIFTILDNQSHAVCTPPEQTGNYGDATLRKRGVGVMASSTSETDVSAAAATLLRPIP